MDPDPARYSAQNPGSVSRSVSKEYESETLITELEAVLWVRIRNFVITDPVPDLDH